MNIKLPIWAEALICAVLVGLLLTAIWAYGEREYSAGQTAEQLVWVKRQNDELAAANLKISTLNAQARAAEQQHAADLAAVSTSYQEQMKNEQASYDRTIADLRSGALRLRVQLADRQQAGGSAAGPTGAGTGGCDGAATGELSLASAEWLVGLASEADEVVHQLTACQAVVTADRKINNNQGKP